MGNWKPIDTAPRDVEVWLAAYIVPSVAAKNNGAKDFWDIEKGMKVGNTWCGILGGKPLFWQPVEPVEKPLPPQL